jgi:adenylate kinase family enzyme
MNHLLNFADFLFEKELPDTQGKIISILGPPGSGKGTVSSILKDKYDFQIIRVKELMTSDPSKEVQGKVLGEREMLDLLKDKIKKLDLSKNIIFDGFPRNKKQSVILDKALGELGLGLNHAIYLNIDKSVALKRLKKKSDKDNKKFDEEAVDKRFQDYEVKTLPVIDQYNKSRKMIEMKDLGDADRVTRRIAKRIKISSNSSDQE